MPSAATAKLEKQASTEAVEPIRQAIKVIEHKIRNLEKRKRKIESYREEQKNGKDLNSDQLAAVSKYDEVLQTLDFARDLNKQFTGIALDAAKQQKKQARKDALEKAQQDVVKIKEILVVQDVLQNMGQENVREDFLAGRNGAALLGEEDLKFLDDFYTEVSPKHGDEGARPFQEQLQQSAEHYLGLVEGKPKEIAGTTYAKLKELVTTIHSCGYFEQVREEVIGEEQIEVAAETEVIEEEYVTPVPATDTFPPQAITSASPPAPSLPMANPVVPQPTAAVPSPVESSYFSTATPTYVPAQAPPPPLQQPRPLNEVISSVNSSFNFLQESELDSPDLSVMLTGTAQQNQQPTPPPSGPVPVAPIPTQTFTNQNFATVPSSNVPQQVVYQAGTELAQPHIPGFATATPNPPPPIPMPPSHLPHRSVSPPAIQQTYSNQPAKQPTYTAQTQQMYNTQQKPQQQKSPEQVDHQQVAEQISNVALEEIEEWGQSTENQGDWSQLTENTADWNQQTEETSTDWGSSTNQNDSFITQSNTRVYGSGRGGRMNRGGGRGSSNGYPGNRPRGNYQNGRGGNNYGYRNNESGNNSYYQNGYQQRDNFGGNSFGGGYKRGSRGSGSGDRGGPRGSGSRGGNNARGNRGSNYARGGNKQ